MNTFYRIFHTIYVTASGALCGYLISQSSLNLFLQIILIILTIPILLWFLSMCYEKPKNMFIYTVLVLIGIILPFSLYVFIPYAIGVGFLADYITKDGVFEKKELKNK